MQKNIGAKMMRKLFKCELSNSEIDKICSQIDLFLKCEGENLLLGDVKANIVSLGDCNFLFIEITMLEKPNKKFPKRAGVLIIKEVRNVLCENLAGYIIQSVKTKTKALKASLNHMFSNNTMLRIMIYDRDSWITF